MKARPQGARDVGVARHEHAPAILPLREPPSVGGVLASKEPASKGPASKGPASTIGVVPESTGGSGPASVPGGTPA